ncbi:MAG: hypothetical protein HQM12_21180 [SAR324 cluster bacterium]|nr:hypothetical protein [SAR324 cluster bacterium]
MTLETWVGIVCTLMAIISCIFQGVKLWLNRKTSDFSDLSYWAYGIGLIEVLIWMWYGVLKDDWPLILSNLFFTVYLSFVLLMKQQGGRRP